MNNKNWIFTGHNFSVEKACFISPLLPLVNSVASICFFLKLKLKILSEKFSRFFFFHIQSALNVFHISLSLYLCFFFSLTVSSNVKWFLWNCPYFDALIMVDTSHKMYELASAIELHLQFSHTKEKEKKEKWSNGKWFNLKCKKKNYWIVRMH